METKKQASSANSPYTRDLRSEQEIKRSRGALSCAECRRLKVRCDKKIPCSSCQRRGCASICPNGSLTTGQGTRFVLADTERLHRKLSEMSDRIRILEEALGGLQSQVSMDSHPLLKTDLLTIKTLQELHLNPDTVPSKKTESMSSSTVSTDFIDAFGTLAVREDGASKFYGRSAGSESLLIEEVEPSPETFYTSTLPQEIQRFSEAFPFNHEDVPISKMLSFIETFLPPWQRAMELCEIYLSQAPWFFGPVTRPQLMEELFMTIYNSQNQNTPPDSSSASTPPSSSQSASFTSHDLALLFIIFAVGALSDLKLPPPPRNNEAEHYYQLTRAALTLEPILDRSPSISTVQCLSMMAIYQGMALKDNSIESTWALMGMSTKLAQSIGLHRDSARWRLEPKEVQKRRALFWELFATDAWQSLATGRPPAFTLAFVDCELPQDQEQTMDDDGNVQASFPYWKARFGAECLTAVVEGTLLAKSPRYANILDLDRKIRDLALPKYAEEELKEPVESFSQVMKHFMPINYRGFTLVYLHRNFFAQALYDHPVDPFRSQYAPSFLAAYESACTVLGALKDQFTMFPHEAARYWPMWTHAFSSAIIVGSVVTRAPRSKVAPAAMQELDLARDLFERAVPFGGRATHFVGTIIKLHDKAKANFFPVLHASYSPTVGLPTTLPSVEDGDDNDELAVFGGRTRLVATRQASPVTISPSPQGYQNVAPPTYASSAPTYPPPAGAPPGQTDYMQATTSTQPLASFDSAHPHLVDQYYGFQNRIAAQIAAAPVNYSLTTWDDIGGGSDNASHMYSVAHPVQTHAQSMNEAHYHAQPVSHTAIAQQHIQTMTQTSSLRDAIPLTLETKPNVEETWSSLMNNLGVPSPATYHMKSNYN